MKKQVQIFENIMTVAFTLALIITILAFTIDWH